MSKGVCIIATHHTVYGQWALNLCMSIKCKEPKMKVALLHAKSGANHILAYQYLFDDFIQIPDECFDRNGFESTVRSKVCLYDLSPYDETIFIDADVIMFPTKGVSELFAMMEGKEFEMGSRGDAQESDVFKWTGIDKLKEVYNTQEVYNLSSEFIYFKKGKVAKKIFQEAKKAFDNPKVDFRRFAGNIPDELAFQIAYIKTSHKPFQNPFLPFYWAHLEEKNKPHLQANELYRTDKFGYSMGGNVQHDQPLAIYNNLARYFANQFGLRHFYPMKNKREAIHERHSI